MCVICFYKKLKKNKLNFQFYFDYVIIPTNNYIVRKNISLF